jgi:hypothetical protein
MAGNHHYATIQHWPVVVRPGCDTQLAVASQRIHCLIQLLLDTIIAG